MASGLSQVTTENATQSIAQGIKAVLGLRLNISMAVTAPAGENHGPTHRDVYTQQSLHPGVPRNLATRHDLWVTTALGTAFFPSTQT